MFDKSTKIGLLVTGGMALVVLIVVVVVMGKHADERAAFEAYETAFTELKQSLLALEVDVEADATRIVDLAEEKKDVWKDHPSAAEIQTRVMQAKTSLETGKERREVLARFTDIEQKLKNPESLTPEQVKDMRRRLDELEVKISLGGAELVARFAITYASADKVYATRLLEDAKSFEAASADNPRLALVRYQTAEDEVKNLVDRAYRDKNEELKSFFTPLYQSAIEASDRLVAAVYTGDASEKLSPTDCLSGEQATQWNASGTKGFSHRVENGVLQIIGPDADAGKIAVISIGDREQWRNLVVDLEFTVEKGNVDMYFRLGRSPNANTLMYALKTEGETRNLEPGKTYRARASVLGSEFVFRFADEGIDTPATYKEPATWAMSRKGAIGLLVYPGARVRFTRFQVRELR